MAEPFTAIAGIASIASSMVGTISSVQAARGNAAMANYEARLAEQNALAAREAGSFQAQTKRAQAKQVLARRQSLVGASGLQLRRP